MIRIYPIKLACSTHPRPSGVTLKLLGHNFESYQIGGTMSNSWRGRSDSRFCRVDYCKSDNRNYRTRNVYVVAVCGCRNRLSGRYGGIRNTSGIANNIVEVKLIDSQIQNCTKKKFHIIKLSFLLILNYHLISQIKAFIVFRKDISLATFKLRLYYQ